MGNKKSKRKNRGGALDCQYPSGDKTRSSNGICPSGSININDNPVIKSTVKSPVFKSPVITCKKDDGDPQSFLVSELKKTKIQVDDKEEVRPLCPNGYYFDIISRSQVAYQELISEDNFKKKIKEYNVMAKEKIRPPLYVKTSQNGTDIVTKYEAKMVDMLLANGTLNKDTDLYRHEGTTEWAPLSQFQKEEEEGITGGKRKRTFRRRKQRKQRKTNKK